MTLAVRSARRMWVLAALLSVTLPPALVGLLRNDLNIYDARDEVLFHLPTTRAFAASLPRPDLHDYASATTPLYHLILAPLAAVTDGAVAPLRVATLLMALSMLCAAVLLVEHRPAVPAWGSALLLLPVGLSPYFLGPAVRLSTDDAALMWVTLCLVLLDRGQQALPRLDLTSLALAASAGAAAVLTRQVHGWVVGLLVLLPLLATESRWPRRLAGLAIAALPVIALAPLVWLWRGLTPPSFAEHQGGLNVAVLQTELAVLGGLGLAHAPWLLSSLKGPTPGRSRQVLPWVGASLVAGCALMLAWPLPYVDDPLRYGGSLWRLSSHLPDLAGSTAGFWVLVPLGLLWLGSMAQDGWRRRDPLPAASLCLFLVANVASARAYQKYYEPLLLIILAWVVARTPAQRWWWWVGPALLASAWLAVAVWRFML